MLRRLLTAIVVSLLVPLSLSAQKPKNQMYTPDVPVPAKYKVDTRIDNMSYWRRMASLGLVPVQPEVKIPPAVYSTSKLTGRNISTEDSPDVPVSNSTITQSENSVFVNPEDPLFLLESNNSITPDDYETLGADGLMSSDGGLTWSGSVYGAGGTNKGDPSTAISLNGRYYVGYVNSVGGQSVCYSNDNGNTWHTVVAANTPTGMGSMLDKNHLWIDNSPSSPYVDNLYDAWTVFGGLNDSEIEINRSTDDGLTWSTPVSISNAINAGSHNQGVNLQTGPGGEVYAIWAVYDSWNPSDETALGFSRSLDGGITWLPAVRVVPNMKGVRATGVGKNHRVNSYPVMAVDISEGPNRGTIYAVWTNIGVPGQNTGNDVDIYMIRSTDQGATWTAPARINQDAAGLGKKHYFPWITCDPVTGFLSIIYYDDRNVSANQCEVYTSNSSDGGVTWWDMKVSDVAFTPQAIGGVPGGYMGDYLGNSSRNGWVYPVWTDTRPGYMMSFISPFQSSIPPTQPWVVYAGHAIMDNNGNSNGLMDFGEALSLTVALENSGTEQANQVIATLSTDCEYITITDNTEAYGDMPEGTTMVKENAFSLSVAPNVPDGLQVLFTITAVDANDSTFISNFIIEAHAPGFGTGELTLTETSGNGNGQLDAGETATISIETINTGDYTAYNANALLTSTSPYITINTQAIHFDSITNGTTNAVVPVFEIITAPETPVGYYASFNYQIATELHSSVTNFAFPVGLIFEDWESNTFNTFDWQFAGSANWQISDSGYEGNYSATSGAIGDNSTSELYLDYNVKQYDSISFYLKTSCEVTFDNLAFYIDDYMLGRWWGETGWQRVALPVNPGQHRFRWIYTKDSFNSGGEDKAWVDFIVLPDFVRTTAYAGPDGLTCYGESFMLNGLAENYSSVLWNTSGDGSFDNPASVNCFYTPGVNDRLNGSVVITLTVFGPSGQVATDNMTLSVSSPATITPMGQVMVCQGEELLINGNATEYTGLSWSTSGSGYFTNPVELSTAYIPSAQDYTTGSVEISLTATSEAPCGDASESFMVQFNPLPQVVVSRDSTLCAGQSLTIAALAEGQVSYLWTPGNLTTSAIHVDSTGHGLGTEIFTVTVADMNGCSSTHNVNVTFLDCTGISESTPSGLSIYPNPSKGSFDILIPPGNAEKYTLEIYDLNNRLAHKSEVTAHTGSSKLTVKALNLGDGIYNLKLSGKDKVYTEKLVIKK